MPILREQGRIRHNPAYNGVASSVPRQQAWSPHLEKYRHTSPYKGWRDTPFSAFVSAGYLSFEAGQATAMADDRRLPFIAGAIGQVESRTVPKQRSMPASSGRSHRHPYPCRVGRRLIRFSARQIILYELGQPPISMACSPRRPNSKRLDARSPSHSYRLAGRAGGASGRISPERNYYRH